MWRYLYIVLFPFQNSPFSTYRGSWTVFFFKQCKYGFTIFFTPSSLEMRNKGQYLNSHLKIKSRVKNHEYGTNVTIRDQATYEQENYSRIIKAK